MKRSLRWAAGTVLLILIAAHAHAGKADAPSAPRSEGKALKADQAASSETAVPAATGSSVVERDKKRYENQKRAADRRAAEMRKADKAKQPAKSGSSVVERDKKRYENQQRAADRRTEEMKKADKGKNKGDVGKKGSVDAEGQAPAMK